MPKFHDKVGYVFFEETAPGVMKEVAVEKTYYGDVIRNTRRLEGSGEINDNINISNSFSIVADPYAQKNIFALRYVHWMGADWKITNVEVQPPRLILSVGGLYNNGK